MDHGNSFTAGIDSTYLLCPHLSAFVEKLKKGKGILKSDLWGA